jgi:hypothetical protein
MQYVWSLITLVSSVFSFSAVYQWIDLTSLFILIVFWAPKYFILNVLKRSLILEYGPTGGRQSWRRIVAYTKYNFTCRVGPTAF